MSQLTQIFSDIANSLRSKMGVATTFKPNEMAPAINSINTGEIVFNSLRSTLVSEFNGKVIITNNVTNLSSAFNSCSNFNQPVVIPNSVTNMAGTFSICSNFNQPINIPDNVTNMVGTFSGCVNFNQPVSIPNGVTALTKTFSSCMNLNCPVTIPNSVTIMTNAFSGCINYNQPTVIPNSVMDLSNAFLSCINFNSPVVISSCANNLCHTFEGCINFNQPVTIPAQPEGVSYSCEMEYTFHGCRNLNQPIIISSLGVQHLDSMLEGCVSFGSTVTFTSPYHTITGYKNMFAGTNNAVKKSIIGSPHTINCFMGGSSGYGLYGYLTWTELSDHNGYYNAGCNIYLYNNYSG